MPRADAVPADPELVSAAAVLGRATVKGLVGGGGAREVEPPFGAVAVAGGLAKALRAKVMDGRTERGRLPLDLRCVPPHRDCDVYTAARAA